MKLLMLIGLLSIISLFAACSGTHSETANAGSMHLPQFLTGGTSSGGPAARLKTYIHCTANDGFLTLDVAGDLGARQAQVSNGLNPCAQAWGTFSEYPIQNGLSISFGNRELSVGAPISNVANPTSPHLNFSSIWTDGTNTTPMVCSLYDGYLSTSSCATGETEIFRCPALGTSICVQEH